jgi:hypothetical protein
MRRESSLQVTKTTYSGHEVAHLQPSSLGYELVQLPLQCRCLVDPSTSHMRWSVIDGPCGRPRRLGAGHAVVLGLETLDLQ